MPKELSPEVVQRYAKLGAQARLEQLDAEKKAIFGTFPDLAPARRGRKPGRRARVRKAAAVQAGSTAKAASKKASRMSAAARKAVSERMKKYWADRRRAKAKAE